jgi:hypothetical protein
MSADACGTADLHIHSTASDGSLTPAEIVNRARRVGLRAIAIADHDCIDGVAEAIREGERCGVEVVPAVEISSSAGTADVHLLGYMFDPGDGPLGQFLRFFQRTREERAVKIVERLNELGFPLPLPAVVDAGGTGSIGRMHIARALVEEGLCGSVDEAFRRLLRDGGPAFIEKYRIPAAEAIDVIHRAGGLAFLAHPGFYADEELMADLFASGLDGLEVYNPKHRQEQIFRFRTIIRERGALESGGSDFHSEKKRSLPFGKFRVPYTLVEGMRASLSTSRTESGSRSMNANRGRVP